MAAMARLLGLSRMVEIDTPIVTLLAVAVMMLVCVQPIGAQYMDEGGPFDTFPSPYDQMDDARANANANANAIQPISPTEPYGADTRFRSSRGDYAGDEADDAPQYADDSTYDGPRRRDWGSDRDDHERDSDDLRDAPPPRLAEVRTSEPLPAAVQAPSQAPAVAQAQAAPLQLQQLQPAQPLVLPGSQFGVTSPMPITAHPAEPLTAPAAAGEFRMMQVGSAIQGQAGTVSATQGQVTAMTTAELEGTDDGGADGAGEDPLDAPLEEIKKDIIGKSKQIQEELAWIQQVDDVIKKYTMKIENVRGNVDTLRQEVKELLKKKRQIQNLKLQKQLTSKLDDANADMGTISTALNHVRTKETNFQKTKKNLGATIGGLKTALAALKGQTLEQMEAEERGEDPDSMAPAPADPAAAATGAAAAAAGDGVAGDTASALAMLIQQSAQALVHPKGGSPAEAVAAATKALAALNGINQGERGLVNQEAAFDPETFTLRNIDASIAAIPANGGAMLEERVNSVSRALLGLQNLRSRSDEKREHL